MFVRWGHRPAGHTAASRGAGWSEGNCRPWDSLAWSPYLWGELGLRAQVCCTEKPRVGLALSSLPQNTGSGQGQIRPSVGGSHNGPSWAAPETPPPSCS